MTTELFDQTSNTNENQESDQDPLKILVGEGRKYKDTDALAKAMIHMDDFAEKLKGENAELRTKAAKADTLEEVLKRLSPQERSSENQDSGSNSGEQGEPGLTADAVARIVAEQVTGLETAKTKKANLDAANTKMFALFGDKANEIYAKEASTPELQATFKQLAETSPEKFVSLFTQHVPEAQRTAASKSTVNTAGGDFKAQGTSAEPGTKAFYNELRRKDPSAYYSRKVQLEMLEAADKDSQRFFGR